jgi:hypothetical protein
MTPSNLARVDDHGASKLPRTAALARLAITAALSSPQKSRHDIVAERWPAIGQSQRDLLTHIGPQAAAVESIDMPPSTAAGALYTGISQRTLLGALRVLADVKLRSTYSGFAATEPTGVIHIAGKADPLMKLDFSQPNLEPIVAAALLVISRELAQDSSAEAGLNDLLLRAVAKAADAEFVARALNGASASGSGADTPFQLRAQVRAMVAALIAAGANAALITLAASPATLVLLATASDPFGNASFPTVTVTGGTLCGLPLVPSVGVADGRIVAVAGDAVLRAAGSIDVQAATSGRLEFNSAPTGEAQPGTAPVAQSAKRVDLFAADMVGLRVYFTFGADFVRATRAKFIDGITLVGSTA